MKKGSLIKLTHLVEGRGKFVKEFLGGIKDSKRLCNSNNVAETGTMVDGRDTDVAVDLALTIEVLDPVAGQDASLGVADDIDLAGPSLVQDIVGKVGQLLGGRLDRVQTAKATRDGAVDSVGQGKDTVAPLNQDGCDVAPRVESQQGCMDLQLVQRKARRELKYMIDRGEKKCSCSSVCR